jgi:general secretion pathway protein G
MYHPYMKFPLKNSIGPSSFLGFSLLELLVVVAIIALLSSYVGPKLFSQLGKSEVEAAKAQIDSLGKALGAYRIDTGKFPSTEQGLSVLTVKPATEIGWSGPYLQKSVPPDPWGRPYTYTKMAAPNDFEIKTLGKDGREGGTGEDADISSNR